MTIAFFIALALASAVFRYRCAWRPAVERTATAGRLSMCEAAKRAKRTPL